MHLFGSRYAEPDAHDHILYRKRGAAGCSEQQIADRLGTSDIVGERIHAMVASRLAIIDQDSCRLTRSGRFYATLFELAAATFRLPMGG
jgi:hypothetical protein